MATRKTTESPSPPKSPSSQPPGRRLPLGLRPDSELNEMPVPSRGHRRLLDQENFRSPQDTDDENAKVYSMSPFPTLDSQILQPSAQPSRHLPNSLDPFYDRNVSTTDSTPSTSRLVPSDDTSPTSALNAPRYNFSLPFSSISNNPAPLGSHLVNPTATIRLVKDQTPPSLTPFPRIPFALSSPSDSPLTSPRLPEDPADWPLPLSSHPPRRPSTPTPAARNVHPMHRAVATLRADTTAHSTPGSIQSVNSSGTQVHRTSARERGKMPEGSYLHYAGSTPRESLVSDFMDSSPIFRTLDDSSPIVQPLRTPGSSEPRQTPGSSETPMLRDSQFSFQRDSGGFPALIRYLEAIEADISSPAPSSAGVSSPNLSDTQGEFGPSASSTAQRWNSIMTSSMRESASGGTTAPSSIRVISAEPSNIFDESETSRLTEITGHSSSRVASGHPPLRKLQTSEVHTRSDESLLPSSIRLVSPEAVLQRGEADKPVRPAYTDPTVWFVEHESGPPPDQNRYTELEFQDSPMTEDSSRHSRIPLPGMASSPVWVSYSSPAQLPHISTERAARSSPQPSASPSQLSLSERSPVTVAPVSKYQQNTPSKSTDPQTKRLTFRRKSIRHSSQGSIISNRTSVTIHGRHASGSHLSQHFQDEIWQSQKQETQAATSSIDANALAPVVEIDAPPEISHFSDDTSDASSPPSLPWPIRNEAPLVFPAASSSVNASPVSIRIPRNRPPNSSSRIQHIRAITVDSTGGSSGHNSLEPPIRSPRRSSSPTLPQGYPSPSTPPERPPRPDNPTPGVTPSTIQARDRRIRPLIPAPLSAIGSSSAAEVISYPSIAHRSTHLQLPGRVGNRDFSPHLWHGARNTVDRRSVFRPPSIGEARDRFLTGAKTRRDLQVACFAVGFLLPVFWIIGSFVPLPNKGNVEAEYQGRKWKRKTHIGGAGNGGDDNNGNNNNDDLEKLGGYNTFSADQVAAYESARWWRAMNRCLSLLGISLILILIVIGVLTGRGRIQF